MPDKAPGKKQLTIALPILIIPIKHVGIMSYQEDGL